MEEKRAKNFRKGHVYKTTWQDENQKIKFYLIKANQALLLNGPNAGKTVTFRYKENNPESYILIK